MGARPLEREAKLDVPAGFRLPALDGVVSGVVVEHGQERHLEAVYVDTTDLRLLRHGLTLRHRVERHGSRSARPAVNEWTLKVPAGSAGGGVVARHELSWPAEGDGRSVALPPAVSGLVRAYRRTAPLGAVARLVTHRRPSVVSDARGQVLLEIDDDVVSVMYGPRLAARFREVEVEVVGRPPAGLLDAVVGRLVGAGAAMGDGRPKLARALGPATTAGPDVTAVATDGESPMADVVRAAVARSYRRLLDHDIGVRLGEDAEAVHQARVATRRLRSDLRTFAAVVERGWYREMQAELGWLAGALGEVRDLDVLGERVRAHLADLTPADAHTAGALVAQLLDQREDARRVLLSAMDTDRYGRLLDRLVEAAEAVPVAAGGGAGGAARQLAPAVVAAPWRRLRRSVAGLGPDPSDDALHQVRIRTKRVRYACDAVAGAVGAPAADMAKAAAQLQEVLGDLHDAVVAEQWLRGATAGLSAAQALVAGQIVAREQAAAAHARGRWRPAWDKLDDPGLRAWLR